MAKQNFDGITNCLISKSVQTPRRQRPRKFFVSPAISSAVIPDGRKLRNIDAITKIQVSKRVAKESHPFLSKLMRGWEQWQEYLSSRLALRQNVLSWSAAALLLVVGFGIGAFSVIEIPRSQADAAGQGVVPRGSTLVVLDSPTSMAQMPDNKFFQMTIAQLEEYLDSISPEKLSAAQQAKLLAERKIKLLAYLQEKQSPFVDIVDTLAVLPHWKMVLAVSNSESSLGKHCYSKNCSGIGVAPGHPLWREYESTADWAKDLNNLIEKRYKDWTLEKMNGVYVQPGSKNWVLAAKQILSELQENGIE